MQKLLMFLLSILLSAIGWRLGAIVGPGTAWLGSSIGLLAGVYLGWRLGRTLLE